MKPVLQKSLRAPLRRRAERVAFYLRNLARESVPQVYFRAKLDKIFLRANELDLDTVGARLDYYNKLSTPFRIDTFDATVSSIPMRSSLYYYDLKEHARYFSRDLKLNFTFGDVTYVPTTPRLVKSRPINGDNANSVLLNLNKFRHFFEPGDRSLFADKKPMAVWRGNVNNRRRHLLVEKYGKHSLCNVGKVGGLKSAPNEKPFMSIREQLGYRYIISVEGNDVATNLKWILASISLCMQPKSVYETWFMEGTLVPGTHFVQLRDDFEDLEEKILFYERHQDEAQAIIRNAKRYVRQFRDGSMEQLVSLLVMHKYFVLSGQMDPHPAAVELLRL